MKKKYIFILLGLVILISVGFLYYYQRLRGGCGEGCKIELYPPILLQRAIREKDPEICSLSNGGILQDVGISKDDSIEYCKTDYAIKTNDIDYCLTLRNTIRYEYDNVPRNGCIIALAPKYNDYELCSLLNAGSTTKDIEWRKKVNEKCWYKPFFPSFFR